MLSHAGLPDSYWAEAVATAAYVRNHCSDKTPYKQLYGGKPNISHFKVFGCMAYAHIPDAPRQKLDKKSEVCFWVQHTIQGIQAVR